MQLKIAKQLVRFILLALVIQFLSPVLVDAGTEETNAQTTSFSQHTKSHKNVGFLILLNENEEKEGEKEGKESFLSEELVDFSCVASAIASSHSQANYYPAPSVFSAQPLFTLHCILII